MQQSGVAVTGTGYHQRVRQSWPLSWTEEPDWVVCLVSG